MNQEREVIEYLLMCEECTHEWYGYLLMCEECTYEWYGEDGAFCPCCRGCSVIHPDADSNSPHGCDEFGMPPEPID